MKTILMNALLVQSMGLNRNDLKQLQRHLGTLQGLARTIRGFPTPRGHARTERAILAELEAVDMLGRNLAWGLLPTDTGLACFHFRMEAIVRAALALIRESDPERGD